MMSLVFKRILQGVAVLLLLSALIFGLMSVVGGDALTAQESNPQISREVIRQLRQIYGLNSSFIERYRLWLGRVVRGDLGFSIHSNQPVFEAIWPRLKNTVMLSFVAIVIALVVSMVMAVVAVRARQSWVDRIASGVILITSSTPRLVVALVTLAVAARWLHFSDMEGEMEGPGSLRELILGVLPPAFVLSWPLVALFLSQIRESLRVSFNQEYVLVARAKGASEMGILFRHVLRPALAPLITMLGYAVGSLLSGAVIVEKVLGWPGIGELSVTAIAHRDIPLLMGILVVTVTAVLIGNLLSDVLLQINDPRLLRLNNISTRKHKEAKKMF